MADKKEPPFFNEDNVGPFHFRLPSYEAMELLIETLTGTCFQLRVSPFETLASVKAKIHRLEGIPVAQQHLIWNSVELEDECCLQDYNIADGSTLRLVLAMRGGPINTRRVAVDDSVKEMAEYMDGGRDEVPPNKQVTYLVYREGDQLNFFRVVDRGDGTLTPVSESVSSVCNLYAEEDLVDPGSGQQALENSITMSKMKLLKAKMEDMNLNRKPKKTAALNPRPPGGPRTCAGYLAPGRHHRPFRILPQIGQSLPPAWEPKPRSLFGPAPVRPSRLGELEGEGPWESPALGRIPSPPKVSRVKDRPLPPLSGLANRGLPDGAPEEPRPSVGEVTLREEAPLTDSLKTVPLDEQRRDPLTFDLPSPEVGRRDSLAMVAGQPTVTSRSPRAVGSDCTDPWTGVGPCAEPAFSSAPSPAQHLPHFPALSSLSLLKAGERPGPAPAPALPARSTRFRAVRADSPDARLRLVSEPDHRPPPVPLEPPAPRGRPALLASLSRSREGGPGGLGRPCASIRIIQEDLLLGPAPTLLSSGRTPGGPSSSVRREATPTYHLPPVKAPPSGRKKSSKHCFLCRRKTGLASSFQCRCGNNFCSTHRYAETHDCSFDYKAAGRRLLQETNPIVTAPKLPKI